jgi:DNA-directed RNA polymerase I subunit RPA1
MGRNQVNMYTCKLRLLQYGLIDEVAVVDTMGSVKGAKSKAAKGKEQDSDNDDEPDDEDYMKKRSDYVSRCIREVKKSGKLDGLMGGGLNPIAAEARRELVKTFLKEINSFKKCVNCSGYVVRDPLICASQLTSSQCVPVIQEGPLQQNFP